MKARSLRPVPETISGWLVMASLKVAKLVPNSLSRSPLAETYLIAWAIAMLVERATYYILKNTLMRLRPADFKPNFHSLITASDKFSFPSGHTSAAFCIATISVLIFG